MDRFDTNNGIACHYLKTQKFKTNVIVVLIRGPLTRKTAAMNSLLAIVLAMGCKKHRTKREISVLCESMSGAGLEITAVKKGEEHIIQIYLEVLSDGFSKESNMDKSGELIYNMLFCPLTDGQSFNREYFSTAKGILIQKIRSKINDKKKYALDRCVELMCEGESFSIPQEGYDEDVQSITASELYDYYKGILSQNSILIGAIGDIDGQFLNCWVRKYFSEYRSGIKKLPRAVFPKPLHQNRKVIEQMGLSQGNLVIGIRLRGDAVDENFLKFLLFNEVMTGGTFSKLFLNLRERNSLCYYINSFIYRAKALMVIRAGINEDDFEKVLSMIKEQILLTANGGVTEYEINCAKDSLTTHFRVFEDSPHSLMEFYLSNILQNDYDTVVESVDRIVQIDDISECARQIFFDTAYLLK